jgi:hypothetical protein
MHRSRSDPYDSSADDDLRRCARCGEQREYCHGHTPVVPNASLDLPPNPPRVTLSGSVPPNGVARFNLSRAEATALAARLTTSLRQDHQDATPVPPVCDYQEEFARVVAESLGISTATAAEGLGLRSRRGRRGGQGRGNRPHPLPDNERPLNTQPTQPRQSTRRPASPTPPGFEHKRRSFQESIRRLEDQMFTTDIERRMCVSRLEAARAMVRIQAEMQGNRQVFRLSPWSLERGRLP